MKTVNVFNSSGAAIKVGDVVVRKGESADVGASLLKDMSDKAAGKAANTNAASLTKEGRRPKSKDDSAEIKTLTDAHEAEIKALKEAHETEIKTLTAPNRK